MVFDELSIAAFRLSLRRSGDELEGGGRKTAPPGPMCYNRSTGPARVKSEVGSFNTGIGLYQAWDGLFLA